MEESEAPTGGLANTKGKAVFSRGVLRLCNFAAKGKDDREERKKKKN
jgi:hypothetical protein